MINRALSSFVWTGYHLRDRLSTGHSETGFGVAIYRCEAKAISRGQGRSCVAAAAYRHAVELRDERQQMTHGYTKKQGVKHSDIIAPEGAPDWATDREKLWNKIDAAEKRKDAMTAREVLLALPRELTLDQQIQAVHDFCRDQFASRGIIADVAIHAPDARDGEKQPHAHIMVSDRALDASHPTGLASKKDRTLADAKGIEALREAWGRHCNRAMERAGLGERVDHRSLKAQRAEALAIANDNRRPDPERRLAEVKAVELDRQPEPKIGAVAAAMDRQRRGADALALQDALTVRRERHQLHDLARELHQVVNQVTKTVQAGREQLAALWKRTEQAFGRYREDIRRRELIGDPLPKPKPKPVAELIDELFGVSTAPQPPRNNPQAEYEKIKKEVDAIVGVYAAHIKDQALERMSNANSAEKYARRLLETWDAQKPQPPKGLFAAFKRNSYERELDVWDDERSRILDQITEARKEYAEYKPYSEHKAKTHAEELTRKNNPELMKSHDYAKKEYDAFLVKDRPVKEIVDKFKLMALQRESKSFGYTDQGSHWRSLPPAMREQIEAYNAMPEARRAAVLETMREQLRRDPKALAAARQQERERTQGQGRGRGG